MVYRASGVLNFASGSLGAISAFLFFGRRDNHGVNWILALAVALSLGGAIGAATQLIVMGLLRRASLKVLFTSGYSSEAIIHHGQLDAGVLLLAKPYRKSDLARMRRAALAA